MYIELLYLLLLLFLHSMLTNLVCIINAVGNKENIAEMYGISVNIYAMNYGLSPQRWRGGLKQQ